MYTLYNVHVLTPTCTVQYVISCAVNIRLQLYTCFLTVRSKHESSKILNDIGRNSLLGKKIAKFLMRTFTCRSTFLYGLQYHAELNLYSRYRSSMLYAVVCCTLLRRDQTLQPVVRLMPWQCVPELLFLDIEYLVGTSLGRHVPNAVIPWVKYIMDDIPLDWCPLADVSRSRQQAWNYDECPMRHIFIEMFYLGMFHGDVPWEASPRDASSKNKCSGPGTHRSGKEWHCTAALTVVLHI